MGLLLLRMVCMPRAFLQLLLDKVTSLLLLRGHLSLEGTLSQLLLLLMLMYLLPSDWQRPLLLLLV